MTRAGDKLRLRLGCGLLAFGFGPIPPAAAAPTQCNFVVFVPKTKKLSEIKTKGKRGENAKRCRPHCNWYGQGTRTMKRIRIRIRIRLSKPCKICVCVCVYICWWLSVFVSCLAVVPPPPQPLSPSPPDELSFPWLYAIWITQVSWHFCASVLWSFSSLLSCSCVSVGICVQEGKSVRYNIIIKWIAKVCPYQTCVVHQGMQTRDGKYSFWEEEILILEFR